MNVLRLGRTIHRQLHTSAGQSSVNAEEIAHFSRLSSQWWDEQGEFGLLHRMNPVRMQFIRDKVLEIAREVANEDMAPQDVLKGLDVLDVGCGGGLLSESLARLGARTTGIDASESNIRMAEVHAAADGALNNLTYVHAPAERLLESSKQFDIVCSMEVIEHVENPSSFLSTCAELVKPGGHLFLSTISRTPLAYLLTIFLAEDVLRMVSRGTHTYSKYIRPSELVSFFQKYRSPIQTGVSSNTLMTPSLTEPWISPNSSPHSLIRTQAEIRGLIYNPLQGRWILAGKNAWCTTDCNYMFWVRKPIVQVHNSALASNK